MRLHIRRSGRVSHPNSSFSFEQFETCHAQVPAWAAWYCTLSSFSIWELKGGNCGGGLIFGGNCGGGLIFRGNCGGGLIFGGNCGGGLIFGGM